MYQLQLTLCLLASLIVGRVRTLPLNARDDTDAMVTDVWDPAVLSVTQTARRASVEDPSLVSPSQTVEVFHHPQLLIKPEATTAPSPAGLSHHEEIYGKRMDHQSSFSGNSGRFRPKDSTGAALRRAITGTPAVQKLVQPNNPLVPSIPFAPSRVKPGGATARKIVGFGSSASAASDRLPAGPHKDVFSHNNKLKGGHTPASTHIDPSSPDWLFGPNKDGRRPLPDHFRLPSTERWMFLGLRTSTTLAPTTTAESTTLTTPTEATTQKTTTARTTTESRTTTSTTTTVEPSTETSATSTTTTTTESSTAEASTVSTTTEETSTSTEELSTETSPTTTITVVTELPEVVPVVEPSTTESTTTTTTTTTTTEPSTSTTTASTTTASAITPEVNYGTPESVYGTPESVHGTPELVYATPETVHSDKAKPETTTTSTTTEAPAAPKTEAPDAGRLVSIKLITTLLPDKADELDVPPIDGDETEQHLEVPPPDDPSAGMEEGMAEKYLVEEKTPDGHIVGEFGVISRSSGSLIHGVRYVAHGSINPDLIKEALRTFLSLK